MKVREFENEFTRVKNWLKQNQDKYVVMRCSGFDCWSLYAVYDEIEWNRGNFDPDDKSYTYEVYFNGVCIKTFLKQI